MGFKDRMVDTFQNSTNSTGKKLAVGAGLGTIAGLANHFLGDGAQELEQHRIQDVNDYIERGAKEDLKSKINLDKDTFTDARDAFLRSSGQKTPFGYMSGQVEDISFKNGPESKAELIGIQSSHPDSEINVTENPNGPSTNPEMKIGDFKVDPNERSDVEYERYKIGGENRIEGFNQNEMVDHINSHKDLSSKLTNLQNRVISSKGDNLASNLTTGLIAGGAAGLASSKSFRDRTKQFINR